MAGSAVTSVHRQDDCAYPRARTPLPLPSLGPSWSPPGPRERMASPCSSAQQAETGLGPGEQMEGTREAVAGTGGFLGSPSPAPHQEPIYPDCRHVFPLGWDTAACICCKVFLVYK